MNDIYEANNYSYELNPEMLKLLGEEFDVDKVTTKFADAIKDGVPEGSGPGAAIAGLVLASSPANMDAFSGIFLVA